MKLVELAEHLSIPRNRDFFKSLQEQDNLTVNQIQQLINSHPRQPVRELLTMIRRQRKASARITDADQLLFTDKGLEQSSSSLLASYHASKLRDFKVIADLTCGIGIDLIHLAEGKTRIYAADTDAESLAAARYNCQLRQLEQVVFLQQSAGDFSQPVEAIYLDPDRRPQGTRQFSPEAGSPPLSEILELSRLTPNILIKLSPALDVRMLQLPSPFTLEFISEKGVLKEILVCLGQLAAIGVSRRAVLLPSLATVSDNRSLVAEVSGFGKYLLTPDPAVIKGELLNELASATGYNLLKPGLPLLTGHEPVVTEFGRNYRISEILDYKLSGLQAYIKKHQIGRLVIKTSGFSETVEDFRHRIRLEGKNEATVLLLRLGDDYKMIFLHC